MRGRFALRAGLLLGGLFRAGAQERALVEEKLQKVLAELDPMRPFSWELPAFLKNFFSWLSSLGIFYAILFFLGAAVLLFLLVLSSYSLFMPGGSFARKRRSEEEAVPLPAEEAADFRSLARERARREDYAGAVIQLHLGSLQALRERALLLPGRDYTNREIRRLLKEPPLREAFGLLAREAELLRFKGASAGEELFRRLDALYEENFAHGN